MYGKAKVGRPDWYMMGACIVFALTFSLRSVPLAVLLLLFMPFSLLSLTGELPLPTRNAPIFQTLLCISIPLLVIGAFSSLLLLLPKLLIPSACVWLFGGALMLFLPPGAFRKSRMATYWAVICFAAVVALLIMLLQRYQAYGDLYEGLSYDILRVMMNARTRPQVLYSAYVSGLAASLLGSVAFWSFAVQGVSAQNFAMIRAGATRGRRWFLSILMVLFVPILPMFAGCVDQIRDPRGLRDDRHRKDDDFPDF